MRRCSRSRLCIHGYWLSATYHYEFSMNFGRVIPAVYNKGDFSIKLSTTVNIRGCVGGWIVKARLFILLNTKGVPDNTLQQIHITLVYLHSTNIVLYFQYYCTSLVIVYTRIFGHMYGFADICFVY